MNIRDELLTDKNQSKALAVRVAAYACGSDKNFSELISCFISEDSRLAQRAAWSVSWAAQKRPDTIFAHISVLVGQLHRTDVHDAVIRNSLRVLQEIVIPKEFHGGLLNSCFNFVQNRKTPIAIKAFSLSILFNLSEIYPEIKNELSIIIKENMEFETAAFRARGKKILARL